ncbi:MAG: hypothetical protein N3A57_07760, partial [Negativicutes bacterium]|nr:hypothetical protein [Negativicutes bacterium]
VKNHLRKSYNSQIPLQVLAAAYLSDNDSALSYALTAVVYNYIVARGYTLPQEWEADNVGFTYYTAAGFNPGAGAAVWQRGIDKFGEHGSFFITDILAPNDHPDNSQRRDNYAQKLSQYAYGQVRVERGRIFVADHELCTVEGAAGMSGAERAYLIGGRLAGLIHDHADIIGDSRVEIRDDAIAVNDQLLLYVGGGEPEISEIALRLGEYLPMVAENLKQRSPAGK